MKTVFYYPPLSAINLTAPLIGGGLFFCPNFRLALWVCRLDIDFCQVPFSSPVRSWQLLRIQQLQ